MNPGGSLLIISSSICATDAVLVVETLDYTPSYIEFDRLEYDNTTLRNARDIYGRKVLTGMNLGGMEFIIGHDCARTDIVELGPNSDSNFQNVKKRFDVVEYTVQGAMSLKADVDILFLIAQDHQSKLAKFAHYQARSSGDTPYASLIALQSEDFSYLTTTNVDITGSALDEPVSDVLLTSMKASNDLVIATDETNEEFEYYKTYTITFQKRTLVNLNA